MVLGSTREVDFRCFCNKFYSDCGKANPEPCKFRARWRLVKGGPKEREPIYGCMVVPVPSRRTRKRHRGTRRHTQSRNSCSDSETADSDSDSSGASSSDVGSSYVSVGTDSATSDSDGDVAFMPTIEYPEDDDMLDPDEIGMSRITYTSIIRSESHWVCTHFEQHSCSSVISDFPISFVKENKTTRKDATSGGASAEGAPASTHDSMDDASQSIVDDGSSSGGASHVWRIGRSNYTYLHMAPVRLLRLNVLIRKHVCRLTNCCLVARAPVSNTCANIAGSNQGPITNREYDGSDCTQHYSSVSATGTFPSGG